MTLQPYDSDTFDEVADRLVELSGKFREMARQQRQSGLKPVKLNDRKLQEWFIALEIWAQDARGRQQTDFVRQRGAQRAATAAKTAKRRKG